MGSKARPSFVATGGQPDAPHRLAGLACPGIPSLGDPLTVTPNRCITLDSPMLVNLFGAAFQQDRDHHQGHISGEADGDSLSITLPDWRAIGLLSEAAAALNSRRRGEVQMPGCTGSLADLPSSKPRKAT